MSLSTVAVRETAVDLGQNLTATADRDFLARTLDAYTGSEQVLVLTVPAPLAPPEILLRHGERDLAFFWDPPSDRNGVTVAGIGAAHRIDVRGANRFGNLRLAAEKLWQRVAVEVEPSIAGLELPPRLYGGFAFDIGAASQEPWNELGDGCFTLPRFLYAVCGDEAFLSLAIRGCLLDRVERDRLIDEFEAIVSELENGSFSLGTMPQVRSIEAPNGSWTDEIEAIRAAITDGRFEKIVAARRSRVRFTAPLDTVDVLLRLAQGLRASTRFAFRRARSTFLGATPERLIARHGFEVETEALAGSIASGAEHAVRLLESGKDQREHQLVVDSIVRRLEPWCARFDVASKPRVRELREVLHLHTPIHGTLRELRHVLELVEKLHPTPAVGGVPTAESLRWIAEHEPDERGWYAAPVGWFDAAGDGEFAVALRSSVLRGNEAYLYAGAGIVRDSDPELERHETELKKQALLKALGAS